MEGQNRSYRWSVEEIRYGSIERAHVDTEPELFYLLASASFVEITSDVYAQNLIDYFHSDKEVRSWVERQWRHEEVQHGVALKRYVNTAWPEFDWTKAYNQFYAEYSVCCQTKKLGPTPALEMASRCVVETGTATLYAMVQCMSDEPVLRTLAALIRNDEVRHYKYFYQYYLRYQKLERVPRYTVLRTLWNRVSEVNDEDAYCAFKHVFIERDPRHQLHDGAYKAFCRHYRLRARSCYPYDMAIKMFLKPIGLNRWVQRAAIPLLLLGARYFA